MIAALLLAAATPAQTAIDAERAFAADAQKIGQWTAFRKWSTEDALMFAPQPVNAHEFLKDRKDPPVSVFWWPGRSFVSCDGSYSVNTGPWVGQIGKTQGYFTTVWKRQPDGGWKWVYDGGDALKEPRAEGGDIQPARASCDGKAIGATVLVGGTHEPASLTGMGNEFAGPQTNGSGQSPDGTLAWSWTVGPKGERHFIVQLWNGRSYETVIDDQVAAPPQ
jgi:hypothetical protein